MKLLAATFAVVLLLTDRASAQPPLERVIAESIRVRVPVSECVVPAVVVQISRALEIPAEVEYLPDVCRTDPPRPLSNEIDLYGLTAQEAFDKLVSVDKRYRWLESEGVVIVRPLAAWTDPNHFLHRSIRDFAISDVGIRRAIGAVQDAIGP